MQLLHTITLFVHIVIGSIGLIVFWLPVFARKGSPFHKRAGRWFAYGMYAVSASGLVMSTLVLIDPIGIRFGDTELSLQDAAIQSDRIRMFAGFLLMLSVLVFASVRHSLLALTARKDRSLLRTPSHFALQILLGGLGLAIGFFGIRNGEPLLLIFALISVASAGGMLRYSFKKTISRNEWWIEHLGNIIGAGIGAYTGFFAFGGRRLFSGILTGQWQIVPWIVPAIVGVSFTIYLSRHYRQRFATTG